MTFNMLWIVRDHVCGRACQRERQAHPSNQDSLMKKEKPLECSERTKKSEMIKFGLWRVEKGFPEVVLNHYRYRHAVDEKSVMHQ
jgi:hypothetical protein